MHISVTGNNKSFTARPRIYQAGERVMREPYIARSIIRDLYLSPLELTKDDRGEMLILGKGEEIDYHDYTIKFEDFIVPQSHGTEQFIEVGAVLRVIWEDEEHTVIPAFRMVSDRREYRSAELPRDGEIYLDEVDVSTGRARFEIFTFCCPQSDVLVLDVKYKPLISVLALGAVLVIAGSGIAVWRRFSMKDEVES